MTRQAGVFYRNRLAGLLEEIPLVQAGLQEDHPRRIGGNDAGGYSDGSGFGGGTANGQGYGDGTGWGGGPRYYRFTYDQDYLVDGEPISLTLPLQAEPFKSEMLFPFFAGLVPEGWYLHIVSPTIKVDEHDTFGLLMKTCGDCIGAVSLREVSCDLGDGTAALEKRGSIATDLSNVGPKNGDD